MEINIYPNNSFYWTIVKDNLTNKNYKYLVKKIILLKL